jgi:catechol 2,3-dioxygenase-like lactoylglutathione lyase family enzyme
MLRETVAIATVAVRDLAEARSFYEKTLNLEVLEERGGEVVIFKTGASKLFVYRSSFAGTNKATCVTWQVDDVDANVAALKQNGVRFEHYTLPEMHLEGDVHVAGDMRAAWFCDPDGNIHSLVSGVT